ncbi:MAG: hypothetical protein AAF499_15260 [Pseudomonadota bacterium]
MQDKMLNRPFDGNRILLGGIIVFFVFPMLVFAVERSGVESLGLGLRGHLLVAGCIVVVVDRIYADCTKKRNGVDR